MPEINPLLSFTKAFENAKAGAGSVETAKSGARSVETAKVP